MLEKKANPSYVCVVPDIDPEKKLTPLQYAVTHTGATEVPFENEYWNHHEAGLYLDVISGTPLFSSSVKFESGTGWPSFWEPLDKGQIELIEDHSHGMVRIEVRSKTSGAHLGHLFDDGPNPTGLRYCMNSAALRFVPVSKLDEEGLSRYKRMFH